jgi:hypothetical protein
MAATKTEHGPSFGEYMDRPIPSWVRTADGRTAYFVRIAKVNPGGGVCLDQLGPDEFVVAPGLVYVVQRGNAARGK